MTNQFLQHVMCQKGPTFAMPEPPVHELPEFNGGVPGMLEVNELPEFNGGVPGMPEVNELPNPEVPRNANTSSS